MYEALNTRRKATAEQGIKLIAGFDMMTKKNGLIQPVKILFSQPETYVLYKEMMLRMGNSIAQLKLLSSATSSRRISSSPSWMTLKKSRHCAHADKE